MQLTKLKPLNATHTTYYTTNVMQHNLTQLIFTRRTVPTFQNDLVIQRRGCNQIRRIQLSFHTERRLLKAYCIHKNYTMLPMCALGCVLCALGCVLCAMACVLCACLLPSFGDFPNIPPLPNSRFLNFLSNGPCA